MLKGIATFFVLVVVLLVILVYFLGDYRLNFAQIEANISKKELPERDLVFDLGTRREDRYHLKVTDRGNVEFQKVIGGKRDLRSFEISAQDVEKIRAKMDETGIFKLISLDRTYCLSKFDAQIYLDFSWVNKTVPYSNCVDDPTEVREFRKFLYEFLGVSL